MSVRHAPPTAAAQDGAAGERWNPLQRGRVLCRAPLVVTGSTLLGGRPLGLATPLSEAIGDRPATFLLRLSWQVETPRKLAALVGEHRWHAAAHPRHRVVILASGSREAWRLQQAGIPTFLCNHNAFVDEWTYDVLPSAEKTFDAVYNARLKPYKRHFLAASVPSLALIYDATSFEDRQWQAQVRRDLPQACFANHADAESAAALMENGRAKVALLQMLRAGCAPPMPPARVAAWLNRARVGLCLSASEGAMLSSMEYLLCGLPVVSTASIGGRDRYFDPDHTRIVADDPAAIAAAVADLAAARIDPLEVRRRALAMIRMDRRAFVAVVQDLIDAQGGGVDFAARFPALQADGLFPGATIEEIAADALG